MANAAADTTIFISIQIVKDPLLFNPPALKCKAYFTFCEELSFDKSK